MRLGLDPFFDHLPHVRATTGVCGGCVVCLAPCANVDVQDKQVIYDVVVTYCVRKE